MEPVSKNEKVYSGTKISGKDEREVWVNGNCLGKVRKENIGWVAYYGDDVIGTAISPEGASKLLHAKANGELIDQIDGKIMLHIPLSLHEKIAQMAKKENVSIEKYLLYRLTKLF